MSEILKRMAPGQLGKYAINKATKKMKKAVKKKKKK